jgi:tetratricopeptide (TPR) repeat protein
MATKPVRERKLENRLQRVLRRMDVSPEVALEAAQSVLSSRLRKDGPDAPATTYAMGQVADQLRRQRRYAEELLLREKIFEARRRNLGLEHEDTLKAESHLGRVLLDLDGREAAEPLLAHVVSATERSPGTMSSETLDAILCLAIVYHKSARLHEARPLLEEALSEFAFRGQAEGTVAVDVSWLLASVLYTLSELDEAVLISRRVLDVRERTLGPLHLQTLDALEMLIRVLIGLGNITEARAMGLSLVDKRTQILGEVHPDTTSARELLSSLEPPDQTLST